jgi:hypothetical protein
MMERSQSRCAVHGRGQPHKKEMDDGSHDLGPDQSRCGSIQSDMFLITQQPRRFS